MGYRMTPWVWIEVVCVDCAESGPGAHSRASRDMLVAITRRVIREATDAGWRAGLSGDWHCKPCLTARKPLTAAREGAREE